MLTNLDFLSEGMPWPPPSEAKRLQKYENNKLLFEGEHADVYEEDFKRIERVIGNFREVVSYPVILNFQKLITLKIADLLLGEEPKISAGDENSTEQQILEEIAEKSDLINTAYENAIDVSRYGDGIFYVREEDGKGVIDVSQPALWFPIVSPDNLKKTLHHVLAWTYTINFGEEKRKFLKVQIHDKGSYEEREYSLNSSYTDTIGKLMKEPEVIETGLDDFAIVPVHNIVTSDRVTGIDDYTDIDSIISEILVRVGQISRVLDKHAAPSVSGPSASLQQDPATGEWELKMGNYFPRDSKEDPEVEYITWDAHMEANFKQIEKLINFLYTISEMGSAIFGDLNQQTGQVPSGSALRRLMISPLAKVKRIRMRFDPALKKAIKLCSQLGYNELENVSITWQDGLPGDPLEEGQIMQIRTGNKPTMSQKRAIMQYDGMNESQTEEELATIQEEETTFNPVAPAPFSTEGDI